jgi:hypothetical protein
VTTIDLVCLGVGKGASYVLKGIPSTGFALLVDSHPYMLIDCGAGIALSYLRNVGGKLPPIIYISHNHMDHTGDLPIVLGVTNGRPRLLGHPEVLSIVQDHRLHDAPELMAALDNRVEWVMSDSNGDIPLEHGLSLSVFRSVHSYLCYGFMLKLDGKEILGYPVDTAFDEDIFSRVTRCSTAVLDARDVGNYDHASFEDVDSYARNVPECKIWVVHYEDTSYHFSSPNVQLFQQGNIIRLFQG